LNAATADQGPRDRDHELGAAAGASRADAPSIAVSVKVLNIWARFLQRAHAADAWEMWGVGSRIDVGPEATRPPARLWPGRLATLSAVQPDDP